jgi:ATP synthase protein I
MAADQPEESKPGRERARDPFRDEVSTKEARKLQARREQNHAIWFWLGMFGLVGWSVAIPTVIAVALGRWIDATWPSHVSWTLMLLFIGIVLGCLNAWYWITRESDHG